MTGTLSLGRCSARLLTAVALVAAVLVATPGPSATSSTASDGVDHSPASLHVARVVAHCSVLKQARGVTHPRS